MEHSPAHSHAKRPRSHHRVASAPALMVAVLALLTPATLTAERSAHPEDAPRTPWGAPDLQGVWDFRTATPLERPDELAGRERFTPDEAAAIEVDANEHFLAQYFAVGADDTDRELWGDSGTQLTADGRTSLVTDPPDGKVPRTPAFTQEMVAHFQRMFGGEPPAGPEDRALSERCILWTTTPIQTTYSNNNIQIFQTPDHIAILHEMIHDTRFIPLDGRAGLPNHVRQLRGDSRGSWDGDTLVVVTTGFTDKTKFEGAAGNARLVERFTRIDADTLNYEYTVEDPDTYTRPWTALLPMRLAEAPMFEYACHEGNRSMTNMLTAARLEEKGAAD